MTQDLSFDKDKVSLTLTRYTKEGHDSHKTYLSRIGQG